MGACLSAQVKAESPGKKHIYLPLSHLKLRGLAYIPSVDATVLRFALFLPESVRLCSVFFGGFF